MKRPLLNIGEPVFYTSFDEKHLKKDENSIFDVVGYANTMDEAQKNY